MEYEYKNKEAPEGNDRGPYDPEPQDDGDLWFLPAPIEERRLSDLPWEVADRAVPSGAAEWRAAEAENYAALVAASVTVARFGERLKQAPKAMSGRIALASVTALLRREGVWISAEKIALYQLLRVGGASDAQDLARASWAMRRLCGAVDPLAGLHGFLGRAVVDVAQEIPGLERAVGQELAALGESWADAVRGLDGAHALTRAGFAFAHWRALDVAPFEQIVEPAVAAMLIGGDGLAPFLPLGENRRFDGLGAPEDRLKAFYQAVESGALQALMTLERLSDWQQKAEEKTANLSGRTPQCLITSLMGQPLISVDIVAMQAGCSQAAARRNLAKFAELGLIREVTGQARYRFWTAKL